MTSNSIASRRNFHLIMSGCGFFILLMLALLIYVCSRPLSVTVQAAERHNVLMCWDRSTDMTLSAIHRSEAAKSCKEMEKQYILKFQQNPHDGIRHT